MLEAITITSNENTTTVTLVEIVVLQEGRIIDNTTRAKWLHRGNISLWVIPLFI